MSNSEYLKELQDLAFQQDIAKIRTLALEFASTLERLPKLKQEVDAMLTPQQGINYDELAARLEKQLDKAANLLARLDLQPGEVRQSQELEGLLHGLRNAMTLRTIDTWCAEFDKKCQEAVVRMASEKQAAAERVRQERAEADRRKAEAELAKKLEGMFEFIKVPGGSFQMGDTFGDGSDDEKPVHEVRLDSFSIGKYPVTQGQWQAVMGNNPSNFKSGENHPVESVSWDDVQQFIGKLKQLTGKQYRLPTEAEWEYAARSGGKKEKWAGTSNEGELEEYAWYDKNSGGATHTVGLKKPNGLGLYDMSGNVWEWCSDWYDDGYYRHSAQANPPGASSGSLRVRRGGSWGIVSGGARAAGRGWGGPAYRDDFLGFRLALPPGQ